MSVVEDKSEKMRIYEIMSALNHITQIVYDNIKLNSFVSYL